MSIRWFRWCIRWTLFISFISLLFRFLLPFFAGAQAATHLPDVARVQDAIQKQFPTYSLVSDVAMGDLNHDGLPDFAAIVNTPEDDDTHILIFLGRQDHQYRLYAMSGSTFKHDRVEQSILINNASIFLHRTATSAGGHSQWSERFQFAFRTHVLLLTGYESGQYALQEETEDSGRSINFLSGQLIDWRQRGRHRTEKKKPFLPPHPITLTAFDYDQFTRVLPPDDF